MKKRLIIIAVVLAILIGGVVTAMIYKDEIKEWASQFEPKMMIYVDGTVGDDSNDGLSKKKPVKTLTKAQELVREHNDNMTEHICVEIAGGLYTLDETLSFTAEDSGMGEYQIIWRAAKNEEVRISGGTEIKGWELYDKEKNIWVADTEGVYGRDFFVNNERATRARMTGGLHDVQLTDTGFTTTSKELQGLARPQDVEITIKNVWTFSRLHMVSADDNSVVMDPTGWATWLETAHYGGMEADASMIHYAENAYEFLDEPGEWYLNKDTNRIYYMPTDMVDMKHAELILGRLEQLVTLDGEFDKTVDNLTFQDLIFEHTSWNQPDEEGGYLVIQAGVYKRAKTNNNPYSPYYMGREKNKLMPTGAVEGTFTNHVIFKGNTFRHTSHDGLRMGRATKHVLIEENLVHDCGGNGIVLGGFGDMDHHPIEHGAWKREIETGMKYISENNTICDNEVQDIAATSHGCVGIIVGYVARTDVSYNYIHSLPYTAISFGWGWGFGDRELSSGFFELPGEGWILCDNTITYNRIENIMNYMVDGGGIYTLGRNDNTLIANNYIDGVHNDYGGIYLDNGSSGFTVENNVVSNCHRNYIYKGDYNYIQNNYARKETAKQRDYDERRPVGKGGKDRYIFENNYLWDEAKVKKIYKESGIR